MKTHQPRYAAAASAVAIAAIVVTGCSAPPPPLVVVDAEVPEAEVLRAEVNHGEVMAHLEAFQRIADDNGGNRAAGTSGYEASARYVEEQLRAAGYKTERQEFSYEGRRDREVDTFNILADSRGDPEHTIVLGAHLDSVRRGPGINDNASGVAAVLETAVRLAESGIVPANRVRFAFWGGEEDDLVGSQYYVDELSSDERRQTALNLNLDMVASPNAVRFVHDGDGSDLGSAGPHGSDEIERVFMDYFRANSLEAEPTLLFDDSDYFPFMEAGIPVGGLFTGDEGTKSSSEASVFGGTAGRQYDSCYHQACDTVANVDVQVLEEMTDAIAHVTMSFAMAKPAAS
ncbi:M28 family metallopeptidase [Arthrobacter sp. USHLN218]|uniref:M28 family metallopeptidase n=1 Tax=Arthrobacter sp. USHLN218 TaxID=3081232 RepID=UPI0030165C81